MIKIIPNKKRTILVIAKEVECIPTDVITVMLEDALVSPQLSTPGQLLVPLQTEHVAGGQPGQPGLHATGDCAPQLVVEGDNLLSDGPGHSPGDQTATANTNTRRTGSVEVSRERKIFSL